MPQPAPPPTLAGDLGGALGSMEHADVKFIANGKPVYAHRAVLSCESEYFAAMFRFRYVDALDRPKTTVGLRFVAALPASAFSQNGTVELSCLVASHHVFFTCPAVA